MNRATNDRSNYGSARYLVARTADGTYNDLDVPTMGSVRTRFGRNVPLQDAYPDTDEAILTPNPRIISLELLARDTFQPATTLNLLAARIFILMASRRLNSDRFFTTDYTPKVYTQTGMDWIVNNDMTTVLVWHHRSEKSRMPSRLGPERNPEEDHYRAFLRVIVLFKNGGKCIWDN
jgi:hypothetical protein